MWGSRISASAWFSLCVTTTFASRLPRVSAIRMAAVGIKGGGSCERCEISLEATRRWWEKYAEVSRGPFRPSLRVPSCVRGLPYIKVYFLAPPFRYTLTAICTSELSGTPTLLFPSRPGSLIASSLLPIQSTSNRKLGLSLLPISRDVSRSLVILERGLTSCRDC